MKYAAEIINLMGAYPGRDWRMLHLVRYVCPKPKSIQERRAVRKAVLRAVQAIVETGVVTYHPPKRRGCYAVYCWKVRHDTVGKYDSA